MQTRLSTITSVSVEKYGQVRPRPDQGLKGSVVNRTDHSTNGESLKIASTVPLTSILFDLTFSLSLQRR